MARRKGAIAKRGRGKGSNFFWLLALLGLLGVLVAGAVIIANVLSSRAKYDANTLCLEDGPARVYAILLDLTDPLNATQARRLSSIIENEIQSIETNSMISVGVVSESPENWGAQFARCKPADGETANALYENPELIRNSFNERFTTPLEKTIQEMMRAEVQNRSPIMESLQALLAETPYSFGQKSTLTVMIASDLLQHSDILSFYRGEGWEDFKRSGGISRLSRNLVGANIQLIRIPRPDASPEVSARVDPFLSRYFDQQGAAAPFRIQTLGDL